MIETLKARFIHLKKQWPTLLFWLLLPIAVTVIIIHTTDAVQSDTKVPVGLVLEEETGLAKDLLYSIKQSPLIRVYETNKEDALHRLMQHELDSVFILHQGYEEQIRKGKRDQLITSYQSDLSFAYSPVKEMIISYVQQETGRSKAAHIVHELTEQYNSNKQWPWKEVIDKSKAVEKEENLLYTSFSFTNTGQTNKESELKLWNTWGLWSIFSVLSTLLIFDWLIKEKRNSILPRFAFIRFSFKNYILKNFLLYTILFIVFDMIAAGVFYFLLNEPISFAFVGSLLTFRLMINAGAFLLATTFKSILLYHSVSFIITLFLAITSGAILPIDGLTNRYEWITFLHPLQPFLSGRTTYLWTSIFILLTMIWYIRKENSDASGN